MKRSEAALGRAVAVLMSFLLLAGAVLPVAASDTAGATEEKSAALGVLTVCSYDPENGVIRIAGTVNHNVMTKAKNCRIALFRVPSWRTASGVISVTEPLADTAMSIRFEFTIEYSGAEDLLSLYAAAIVYPDGSRALIDEPKYPAQTIQNTPYAGFKGVSSTSAAEIAEAGAGCVMIDVYLDRLEDGRHSGYLQTMGGMSFYYNRDYVDDLDRRIRSASVAGASVYLRLLVSPSDEPDGLCYAASASYGAAYRGVVISDEVSAITVYAYLFFLCARYNGGTRGDIDGLVLGFCTDQPEKFNFCASTGPMYYEIYARTLSVMGIAAAAAGNGVRLIVPVSDECAGGELLFTDFARGVGEYISRHTDLEFTLMIDGTHNAYHLSDSFFETPVDSAETEDPDGRRNSPSPVQTTDVQTRVPDSAADPASSGADTTSVWSGESYASDEETDEPAPEEPQVLEKTTADDPYICPDNLGSLPAVLDSLHGEYSAISREYLWCWTPGEDTSGSSLSVLYSYHYMALASAGASVFILRTDSERFSSVSYLVKYIDTDKYADMTAYALEVLGADSWDGLIPGFNVELAGGRRIIETEPMPVAPEYTGSFMLWDFCTAAGALGWSAGPGCLTLRSVYDAEGGCLKAVLDDEGGGVYSDICCICESPEPIKFTPWVGFELSCSDGAGESLYEVKLVIYSGGVTLEGKTVIKDGERASLYLDVSALTDGGGIDAVRIAARRVSGEGEFILRTYSVSLLSDEHSDRELAALIEQARMEAADRDIADDTDKGSTRRLVTAVLLIGAIAAFGVYAAALISRYDRQKTSTQDDK